MSANCIVNIFLTGKTNSGKSTIINEFLKSYTGTIGGFKTVRKKTSIDDLCGIYLLNISSSDEALGKLNRVGSCTKQKKPISYKQVFETLGVHTLTFSIMPDLIIMDELGVLESDCMRFKAKVIESIESGSDVLGVIKKKSSDFLNSIRARKDVLILDVENYGNISLLQKIREYLY